MVTTAYLFISANRENWTAVFQCVRAAGYPVIEFTVADPYDAGAEFFRWEIAVATACHILGVNAFDQPDVQDSKDRTKAKIAEYKATGKLVEDNKGIGVQELGKVADFLKQAKPGDVCCHKCLFAAQCRDN